MDSGSPTHGTIVFWALIASLTRFIPLPLLDDLLESGFEKTMIRQIAESCDITLSDNELDMLSYDTTDFSGIKVALRSSARLVGRLFLKTLLLFELKDAADTFSAVYHRGYLLDYAFRTEKLKQYSTIQLRVAIDGVCRKTGTSPVNRVFIRIMKESATFLGVIRHFVIKSVTKRGDDDRISEQILRNAPPETGEMVVELEKGLNLMPSAYFMTLRGNLDKALARVTGKGGRDRIKEKR